MLRVLVAEDSQVSRELLVHLLHQDPGLDVVAATGDGEAAVQGAQRLRPDVILMDVHMPVMNGLEATRRIMRTVPTPIVMMTASAAGDEARLTFEAIQAGALTLAGKPRGLADAADGGRRLITLVKSMAEVKVVRRWLSPLVPQPARTALPRPLREVRLVAMGASTGGPPAFMQILTQLPADLGVPVLLVQHITPGFAGALADWLAHGTASRVKLAEDGEQIVPGTGYLAPDGVQMTIARLGRIRLSPPLAGQPFCPSIDHMLASVAQAYGPAALGVILTGMGRDGALGLRQVREAGGLTIAQDEASSAVFGMPREAIRLDAAARIIPLHDIARVISSLVFSYR